MSAIPARVRGIVLERAAGRCESCGIYAPLELHHRLARSHSGKHTPDNLIALHGWGNHTGCHGEAHTASDRYVIGVSIRSGVGPEHAPANRPVLYRGTWVFLLADGGLKEVGSVEF